MKWEKFRLRIPSPVKEVVINGPTPLAAYGRHGPTYRDKRMGIAKFKGTDGREGPAPKQGAPVVLYFDPTFSQGEFEVSNVPDKILERHTRDKIFETFREL